MCDALVYIIHVHYISVDLGRRTGFKRFQGQVGFGIHFHKACASCPHETWQVSHRLVFLWKPIPPLNAQMRSAYDIKKICFSDQKQFEMSDQLFDYNKKTCTFVDIGHYLSSLLITGSSLSWKTKSMCTVSLTTLWSCLNLTPEIIQKVPRITQNNIILYFVWK